MSRDYWPLMMDQRLQLEAWRRETVDEMLRRLSDGFSLLRGCVWTALGSLPLTILCEIDKPRWWASAFPWFFAGGIIAFALLYIAGTACDAAWTLRRIEQQFSANVIGLRSWWEDTPADLVMDHYSKFEAPPPDSLALSSTLRWIGDRPDVRDPKRDRARRTFYRLIESSRRHARTRTHENSK